MFKTAPVVLVLQSVVWLRFATYLRLIVIPMWCLLCVKVLRCRAALLSKAHVVGRAFGVFGCIVFVRSG